MFTSLNMGALGFRAPLDEALSLARTNGFEGLDLPLGELLQLAERTSVGDVWQSCRATPRSPRSWEVRGAPPGSCHTRTSWTTRQTWTITCGVCSPSRRSSPTMAAASDWSLSDPGRC